MTGAPRMLALTTDAFGGRGGIAQYNRDLLSGLARTGAMGSITVLSRNAPDPAETPTGIDQLKPRAGRLAYALAALRLAASGRFDVVYCGHLYMAPLAWLIARLCRARLIVQTYGIEVWEAPSRLRRAATEHADLVLCISRHTRACVLSWAAMAPERAAILAPTVGDAFAPGDGSRLRTEWNLAGRRVLLSVGRMDSREAYKGADRVIAAMPDLVALGHDVVFVAVGEGDDIPRLQGLAAESGVADRVQFRRAAGTDALVEAYRMADLFVMPSTGEGFGIVYLEAMACGTPALGLAVGGAPDPLADGELGIVADDGALAAAIDRSLRSERPEAAVLSDAVGRRFGRLAFEEGARGLAAQFGSCGRASAGRQLEQA